MSGHQQQLQTEGARHIGGRLDNGQLVLIREDESQVRTPVVIFRGRVVDNGDGTGDLIVED